MVGMTTEVDDGDTLIVRVVPGSVAVWVELDGDRDELLGSGLVVAFTDVTSLAFVTIGEDIDDGRTAVFEEVRLGCKVLLEKICTPDVWLTIVELRSNMEGLDICVAELDNITEDVLDNDGTSELVLTNDISVLFIVDETRLVNKDDVGIGEIAFDSVEFPG